MIIKITRHFKLAALIASDHVAAQFLDSKHRGKVYNSLGNQIEIAAQVFPARQEEKSGIRCAAKHGSLGNIFLAHIL